MDARAPQVEQAAGCYQFGVGFDILHEAIGAAQTAAHGHLTRHAGVLTYHEMLLLERISSLNLHGFLIHRPYHHALWCISKACATSIQTVLEIRTVMHACG
jgi:hypothetical protein